MNEHELENRLHADAARIRSECPPTVRSRVFERLRDQPRIRFPSWPRPLPVLAAASGLAMAALVAVLVWTGPESDSSVPAEISADSASRIVPDRLIARREAALDEEWQRLQADLARIHRTISGRTDAEREDS